jgi:hypothetical protein
MLCRLVGSWNSSGLLWWLAHSVVTTRVECNSGGRLNCGKMRSILCNRFFWRRGSVPTRMVVRKIGLRGVDYSGSTVSLVRQEARILDRAEIERRRVIVAELRWIKARLTVAEIVSAQSSRS